jgi:hypothetical protein
MEVGDPGIDQKVGAQKEQSHEVIAEETGRAGKHCEEFVHYSSCSVGPAVSE